FDCAGALTYFTPVAAMPGFSRALARTVHELRLAGMDASRLTGSDPATADVGRLLARVEAEFDRAAVDDRAALFGLAAGAVEGGEAIEIVRRILDEAQRGVPFDQMAVFLRTPSHYLGLLEHACDRGGVPAYFDRGIRRPDPAGRAFVALLSCAVEGLSAKRFDEYLSLGQVPQFDRAPSPESRAPSPEPRVSSP